MKLLSALIGCVFLHQAAAAICKRTIIVVNTLPPGYVTPTAYCPNVACIYYNFSYIYPQLNYAIVNMHDSVILVPTSLSTPPTATMVNDIIIRQTADKTNLYVLTSNLETTAALNAANNKLIIGMGQSVPSVHILDYNSYLTSVPPPAPVAADPCSFFATSPPTVAGSCPRSTCNRTVIVTDDAPPFIDQCPCCPGSCTFYTSAKSAYLINLGLGMGDKLIIQPNNAGMYGWFLSSFDSYLLYLTQTTNVFFITSPGATSVWMNSKLNNLTNIYYYLQVKNYAAFVCPVTLPAGVSCVCNYVAAGMP